MHDFLALFVNSAISMDGNPKFILHGCRTPVRHLHIRRRARPPDTNRPIIRKAPWISPRRLERKTRLELATPTLARSCSTN